MLPHFAFIVILLGALTSFLFGEEGILHLREGETSNQIAVRTSDNTTFHTLPFSVELKKFTLTRYPGSASPSSYESEVIVHVDGEDREERIFMNNVLDVKGRTRDHPFRQPRRGGAEHHLHRISVAGHWPDPLPGR